MKVVLPTSRRPSLDADRSTSCAADGLDVTGVVTDVSDFASVEALRDAALERYGAVHVLCNNAGVGAGAEGQMWDHDAQRLALGPRRERVGRDPRHQGVRARRCSTAATRATSSTRRRATAASPRCRARRSTRSTKSAVVTLTESLYAQLQQVGAPIGASVLFPGPNMLRTGLFESWRNRPAELRQRHAREHAAARRSSRSRSACADARRRRSTTRRSRRSPSRVVDAIRGGHVLDPAAERAQPTSRSRRGPSRCSPARTPPTSATSEADDEPWTATSSSRRTATPGCRTSSTASGSTRSTATRFDAEPRRRAPG